MSEKRKVPWGWNESESIMNILTSGEFVGGFPDLFVICPQTLCEAFLLLTLFSANSKACQKMGDKLDGIGLSDRFSGGACVWLSSTTQLSPPVLERIKIQKCMPRICVNIAGFSLEDAFKCSNFKLDVLKGIFSPTRMISTGSDLAACSISSFTAKWNMVSFSTVRVPFYGANGIKECDMITGLSRCIPCISDEIGFGICLKMEIPKHCRNRSTMGDLVMVLVSNKDGQSASSERLLEIIQSKGRAKLARITIPQIRTVYRNDDLIRATTLLGEIPLIGDLKVTCITHTTFVELNRNVVHFESFTALCCDKTKTPAEPTLSPITRQDSRQDSRPISTRDFEEVDLKFTTPFTVAMVELQEGKTPRLAFNLWFVDGDNETERSGKFLQQK